MKKLNVAPTAKISVRKSLLKKYQVKDEDVYFLKKDSEFEIELFNPLSEVILCRIFFNGKDNNDSGLVLYPGQRIFLERHLETDKKLVFNTYNVEDTEEVKLATSLNGLVKVEFYKEQEYFMPTLPTWEHPLYISPSVSPIYYVSDTSNNTLIGTTTSISSYIANNITQTANTIETGRVEKGNKSNQAFINTYESFVNIPFTSIKFRLLPDSIKLKTEEDFKHKKYCVECGSKVGSTDKFCSQCGTKI